MAQHRKQFVCFQSGPRRSGGPSFKWMILATVLSLGSIPSAAPYWYDPPCQHDFTWTTKSGGTQECRYLDVETLDGEQGVKYCKNPLAPLTDDDESMHPPPLENVQATYYTTEFKYADSINGRWAGFWSGVNFTFQLKEEAAGKVTGILFSMESLSPDSDDYKEMYCRAYSFDQPLSLDALLDQNNNPLQLFMDCFRGQKPGMVYAYTFRTLPFMETSGADPHDTVVKLHYRTPSCYSVPNDYLCKEGDAGSPPPAIALCSYWRPQLFIVTPHYRDLSIAMELGPENCDFDSFKMAVHSVKNATSGVNLWNAGFVKVDVDNQSQFTTFAYDSNITYIKVDMKADNVGQRVITVIPSPTRNTCFRNDGTDTRCSVTLSAAVTIIENPCLTNHCSSLEICDPNGDQYICVCKPGFIRDGHPCVSNPCEVMNDADQVPQNPCGPGTCKFINKDSYSCNCTQGLTFVQGNCQVDPCMFNTCGVHGTCKLPDQSRETGSMSSITASFICECSTGYSYNNVEQSCKGKGTLQIVRLGLALEKPRLTQALAEPLSFLKNVARWTPEYQYLYPEYCS